MQIGNYAGFVGYVDVGRGRPVVTKSAFPRLHLVLDDEPAGWDMAGRLYLWGGKGVRAQYRVGRGSQV